mgnify:CR=1 FL=1
MIPPQWRCSARACPREVRTFLRGTPSIDWGRRKPVVCNAKVYLALDQQLRYLPSITDSKMAAEACVQAHQAVAAVVTQLQSVVEPAGGLDSNGPGVTDPDLEDRAAALVYLWAQPFDHFISQNSDQKWFQEAHRYFELELQLLLWQSAQIWGSNELPSERLKQLAQLLVRSPLSFLFSVALAD